MNRKSSLLIIFLVFALPVLLYQVFKAPKENISLAAIAEAANQPKVLHFSQVMCAECKKLDGIMGPTEQKYKDKVVFVHIDVANRTPQISELMKKHNVNVVPTLVFINKNGQVIKTTEGAIPKSELEEYLDSICK